MTAAPDHYPLLPVGLCPGCRRPVRLRVDGVLRHHRAPNGRICLQRRVDQVPTTFVRWLYLHRSRKDAWTNPITQLAQCEFGGPRMCGDHGPDQQAWTTAEQLHTDVHMRRTHRNGCDWYCEQVAVAGAVYAGLIAAQPADAGAVR